MLSPAFGESSLTLATNLFTRVIDENSLALAVPALQSKNLTAALHVDLIWRTSSVAWEVKMEIPAKTNQSGLISLNESHKIVRTEVAPQMGGSVGPTTNR
jgi:hypothetical protein